MLSVSEIDDQFDKGYFQKDQKTLDTYDQLNEKIKQYIINTDEASASAENFYASQTKYASSFLGSIKAINQYNAMQKQGVETQQAFADGVAQNNRVLGEFLNKGDGATKSWVKYTGQLIVAKVASLGLAAATATLNAAISFGLSAIITGTVTALNKYINAYDEAAKSIKENTDELKENIDSIDEYKNTVISMRKSLEDESISFEESKQVREKLLSIQDEMIAKYGKEIKEVDILKSSIDELSNAYDNITLKEANRWLSDNRDSLGDALENVEEWGGADTLDDLSEFQTRLQKTVFETKKDLESFIQDSENQNAFFNLGIDGMNYDDLISNYRVYVNEILRDEDNILSEEEANAAALRKVYDDIVLKSQMVYNYATKQGDAIKNVPAWLENFGNAMIKNRQGFLDEDIEMYKQAGQYLSLLFESDMYTEATEAVREYNEAIAESDADKQYEALEKIKSIYNEIWNLDSAPEEYQSAIRYYFNNLLEDIANTAEETTVNIENKVNRLNDAFNARYGSTGNKISDEDFAIDSKLTLFAEIAPELNKDEFNTLLNIIHGEIEANIDWFNITPQQLKEKIDNVIAATDFSFDKFFENQKYSDVKSNIQILKNAYTSLSEGIDISDESFDELFEKFPDLFKYAQDTETLMFELQKRASAQIHDALVALKDMYNATNDPALKELLMNAIERVQKAANLRDIEEDVADEYQKEKDQIRANIKLIESEIKELERKKKEQEDFIESLEKEKAFYEEQISNYETAANAVTNLIDEQIQAIEAQKAAAESSYDKQIEAIEKQKAAIEEQKTAVEEFYNEQIEALREEAEERDRINDLREKELALEKAKSNKQRVYSMSRGWEVQVDTEAIESAQKEYDDVTREIQIDELEEKLKKEKADLEAQEESLETRISDLEAAKESIAQSYEARIQEYEDYKSAWQDAVNAYKSSQDEINAAAVFGSDWRAAIYAKDKSIIDKYVGDYAGFQHKIHEIIEPQIEDSEKLIEKYDTQLEEYENLEKQQKDYLDFYKTYSEEFADATEKQRKALEELGEKIAEYNGLPYFSKIFEFYDKAMELFDEDYIPERTTSSTNSGASTALTSLNNASGIELTAAQSTKLNDFLNSNLMKTVGATVGSLPAINNTAFNGSPSYRDRIQKDGMAIRNLGNTENHYGWTLANNNIIVDNYESFKGYMDRFIREAKQDLMVGIR